MEGDKEVITNSATLTITKMIIYNIDKLLLTIMLTDEAHKQFVLMDEDSLELLVKLLTVNEQNGEIVTKIYEVLLHTVEASQNTASR